MSTAYRMKLETTHMSNVVKLWEVKWRRQAFFVSGIFLRKILCAGRRGFTNSLLDCVKTKRFFYWFRWLGNSFFFIINEMNDNFDIKYSIFFSSLKNLMTYFRRCPNYINKICLNGKMKHLLFPCLFNSRSYKVKQHVFHLTKNNL